MTNKQTKDTTSTEALITGISALLVTVLWVAYSPFHPLIILALYLVALVCLSLAVLWYLSEGHSLKAWFVKHPIRFFIVGFIEVFLIVGFLDIFYLYELFDFGKWENILVEAHGLVFDLFIFGIVLTAYEVIRSKQDKIERYKEELDDYRGWTENEAAYRVAGVIRRLEAEGVEDINFERLHLGRCSREIVEKAAKAGVHILSLQKARLDRADLRGADLGFANLQNAFLVASDLRGANLGFASLENAILSATNLQEVDLTTAILQGAILSEANLQEALLDGAILQGANLRSANLQGASLRSANLKGADLSETNLKGVKVDELDWIEKLEEWEVRGVGTVMSSYFLDEATQKDFLGDAFYLIKEKPKEEKFYTPSQCNAKTKNGERCKRKPQNGFDKCYQHLNQDKQNES